MLDVFISYPHQAMKAASQFAAALRARGVRTWYAEEDLSSNGDRKIEIHRAIKDAKAIAVLILPDTRASHWLLEEYMATLESYWAGEKKFLVPIILGKGEPPSFLQPWQRLTIKNAADWDRAARQVMKWLIGREGPRFAWPHKLKQERKRRLDLIEQLVISRRGLPFHA
jgi:hypothetical protein